MAGVFIVYIDLGAGLLDVNFAQQLMSESFRSFLTSSRVSSCSCTSPLFYSVAFHSYVEVPVAGANLRLLLYYSPYHFTRNRPTTVEYYPLAAPVGKVTAACVGAGTIALGALLYDAGILNLGQ